MFLYRISQDVNNGYDTYDSAIVCAESEDEAQMILPGGYDDWDGKNGYSSTWCVVKDVQVEIIGIAANNLPKGVVIASYNAG